MKAPRLPPKSNAERQKEWRQRMKDQGYRREVVWLDPDIRELVDKKLKASPQASLNKLINDALDQYLQSN